MDKDTYAQLLADYNSGMAKYRIATKYKMAKSTLKKLIDQAIKNGDISHEIQTIRNDTKHKVNPRVKLEAEVKYAVVCDLWRKGYRIDEIKKETGFCWETIHRNLERGYLEDNLWTKNSPERLKAVAERDKYRVKPEKTEKFVKQKVYKKVPSTLKEGESIKCTNRVSEQCVYGKRKANEEKCRCFFITGELRTYSVKEGFKNPCKACTCFSKVSKTNPKLANATEE